MKPIIREVSEAAEVTEEFASAFQKLVPQLSRSTEPPTAADLAEIVRSPATVLFAAYAEDAAAGGDEAGGDVAETGEIIGSLTLVLFRIPTGLRARIEDVVVDESARGAGVGKALNLAAVERAAAEGAKSVDLTSSPVREAANELYLSLGFKQRDTNVYRFEL